MLLTPRTPSTAAEGADGLSVEGCSGDDTEARARGWLWRHARRRRARACAGHMRRGRGRADCPEALLAFGEGHPGKPGRFEGSSDPRGDSARFLAPLVGEEDEAGFEPQPIRRGVRPGVQRKSTGLVAGYPIGLAGAHISRRLFDGELTAGVLSHRRVSSVSWGFSFQERCVLPTPPAPQLLLRGLVVLLVRSLTPVFEA